MCQSTQTKEETIIAQTAAGNGKNGAAADQGYYSISTTNILLTLITIVLLAAACYAICYCYKKMHVKWMERQMNRRSLRRRQTSVYFKKHASRDEGADKPLETARILAVFPTPLISHQSAHRSIIHELIHRDHEVVLITPLPEYPRGASPENLMEIDVSEVTNEVWQERYIKDISGKNNYNNGGLKHVLQLATKVVEKQFEVPEVKSFIKNNETFDLLLLEAWIRPTLFWTYITDAPVVSISSFGPVFNDYINMGGPTHPLLYPTSFQHEVWNLNIWQKIVALYDYWKMNSMYNELEKEENALAKSLFGEVPALKEQVGKIEMLLLNIHPVWEGTRPVPMNVMHLGATHVQDRENKTEMTKELLDYLDSSTYGVIYVNLGTNIRPWMVPEPTQRKLISAFRKLSCNVLWKWDDDVNDLPYNVKVGKWFPQAELLKHPNIRLFISQCGQQSMDEAIAAAVTVLGLPVAADQWRNAEQLLRHKVGSVLDLEKVDDEEFKNIIEHTMRNESYRTNMHRLRTMIFDVPVPAPVHAVDAIEYVLSHSCGHFVSPTLRVSWFQYFEIELFIIVNISSCISAFILFIVLYFVFKMMVKMFTQKRVVREKFKSLL